MKRLWLVAILTLTGSVSTAAQMPRTLLEVHMSSVGMVAVTGNYLLVRVLDDGQVEYEEDVIENHTRKFFLRKSHLSAPQLKELKSFLNDAEWQGVAREYEPEAPTIDRIITYNISINRDSQSQTIKLTNYAPSLPGSSGKYPAKLIELVCRTRSLRHNNVKFRIILNDCSFR